MKSSSWKKGCVLLLVLDVVGGMAGIWGWGYW